MLFVEDLDQLDDLFSAIDPAEPLLYQVIDNFSRTFRFWAAKPELSRVVLPKLGNPDNPHVEKIMQRRAAKGAALIAWLYQFKQHGVIADGCNLEQAAELLFALYIGCVSEWLGAGETEIKSGLERMRYLMEIPVLAFQHPETGSAALGTRKASSRDR
jgi:hypothetical protein